MRRLGIIAVLSLTLVALVATSVSARPATTFRAHANHAEQGGQLSVTAKVKHSTRGATFSATAVVHFGSGDVAVSLTTHGQGRSFHASAKVPVAAGETLGPVPVDVTFTYNSVDQVVSTWGAVQLADDGSDSDS